MDQLQVETVPPLASAERSRQANMVLLACSILQLPIWGFAVSYGVLQEYYSTTPVDLKGNIRTTGIIGPTLNGIIYMAMPLLFGLFTYRYNHLRRQWSLIGIALSAASLVLSSFGTDVWQLIITQGVLQALGSTVLYSATTIYLDEWFIQRKAFVFGMVLAMKSAVGVGTPLLFSAMLSHLGFRNTLRIWAAILVATSAPAVFLLQPRFAISREVRRERNLSWNFLYHRTFWIFETASIIFSASYGIPQTYLSTFGADVLHLSHSTSALMLAALNIPSVLACFWFGLLCDGRKFCFGRAVDIFVITSISGLGSSLPVFFLWGFVPDRPATGVALLVLFAIIYGFFAGGFSATWGGVVKELQNEATARNEALDTALVYGLLNGGRGIGFVGGGLLSVELLKAGAVSTSRWAYGSSFGSLILFTGCGAAFGGWSIIWKLRQRAI